MLSRLIFIVIFICVAEYQAFSQCCSNYCSRCRVSCKPVPFKKFQGWEKDTASLEFGIFTNFAFYETQWNYYENKPLAVSEIAFESLSFGFNISRKLALNVQLGGIIPLNPTIYQDSLFSASNNIGFYGALGAKYYLLLQNRNRFYAFTDISYRSISIDIRRNTNPQQTEKWLSDFLKQHPNNTTLQYQDMLNAMQKTERDYIPISNSNAALNIGLGWDNVLKSKWKANILLRIEAGLRYNMGLLRNNWSYDYCENCKDANKKIQLDYKVNQVPFEIANNTSFFIKVGILFMDLK